MTRKWMMGAVGLLVLLLLTSFEVSVCAAAGEKDGKKEKVPATASADTKKEKATMAKTGASQGKSGNGERDRDHPRGI